VQFTLQKDKSTVRDCQHLPTVLHRKFEDYMSGTA